MRRFLLHSLFLIGLAPFNVGAADWHLSLGTEYYTWHENEDTGREVVEETGPRIFLEIGGKEGVNTDDVITSFIMRFYAADVQYDGETTGGSSAPIPVFSDSIYAGWSTQLGVAVLLTDGIHTETDQSDWYFSTSLGYEEWLRDIQDAQISGITISGYPEVYKVPYMKFGFLRNSISSSEIRFGIKYPLVVDEIVGWSSDGYINPQLNPEPQPSLYASIIFQLGKHLGVHLFYDSYRFDPSPKKPLYYSDGTAVTNSFGYQSYVSQPQSHQDSVGVLISFHF